MFINPRWIRFREFRSLLQVVGLCDIKYGDIRYYIFILLLYIYTFTPNVGTLESCKVIEAFSDSTIIFHQVYKRVWPSSQRETLFMSHIKEIPSTDISLERLEYEVGNPWLSINYSIEHPDVPVSDK